MILFRVFSRVIESNQVQTVTVASDPSLGRSGLEYNPSNHVPDQSKDYQPIKSVRSSDQVNIHASDQLVNGQIVKPTSHQEVNPIKDLGSQFANHALTTKSDNRPINSATRNRSFDRKSDTDLAFLNTLSSVKYNMKNIDFKSSNASNNFDDRDLKHFTYSSSQHFSFDKNAPIEVPYGNTIKVHLKSDMTHREKSSVEYVAKDKKYRDKNIELKKEDRGKSVVTTSDGVDRRSWTARQQEEWKNSQETLYARTNQGRNTFPLYVKQTA